MLRGGTYRNLQATYGFLGIKPIAKGTYNKYKRHIVDVATKVVTSHFKDSSEIIKYYEIELNRLPSEDNILDIDVSFDGEMRCIHVLYKYTKYTVSCFI